jgi:hypothetical protein
VQNALVKTFLLLVWVFSGSSSFSAILVGKIVDDLHFLPILRTKVSVLNSDLTTYSSASGEFSLNLNEDQIKMGITLLLSRYRYESQSLYISSFSECLKPITIKLVHYEYQPALVNLPNLTIQGQLLDESRNPLKGVEIFATNTIGYSVSDTSGNFMLYVDQIRMIDDTEVFFLKQGYKSQLAVINNLRKRNYYFRFDQEIIMKRSQLPNIQILLKATGFKGVPLENVKFFLNGDPSGISDRLGNAVINISSLPKDKIQLEYNYLERRNDSLFYAQGEIPLVVDSLTRKINLQITPIARKLSIIVSVRDRDRKPIPNAMLTLGHLQALTGEKGEAAFLTPQITGKINVIADGFRTKIVEYKAKGLEEHIETELSKLPPLNKLVVTVQDSISQASLRDVLVTFSTDEGTLDNAFTDSDGKAVWQDTLRVTSIFVNIRGYKSRCQKVIERSEKITILLVPEPIVVKLTFMDSIRKEPLSDVRVRFIDGNFLEERTDMQGEMSLNFETLPDSFFAVRENYHPKKIIATNEMAAQIICLLPISNKIPNALNREDSILGKRWGFRFGVAAWRLLNDSNGDSWYRGLKIRFDYLQHIYSMRAPLDSFLIGYDVMSQFEAWPSNYFYGNIGMAFSAGCRGYFDFLPGIRLYYLYSGTEKGTELLGGTVQLSFGFYNKSFLPTNLIFNAKWLPHKITINYETTVGKAKNLRASLNSIYGAKDYKLPTRKIDILITWKLKNSLIETGITKIHSYIQLPTHSWESAMSYYLLYGFLW